MPRPRLRRRLLREPNVTYYKPQGVPLRGLMTEALTHEEWEALRLRYTENQQQHEMAKSMNTSQSSVQRILSSAQSKIGKAIVQGKAIRIVHAQT